MTVRGPGWDDIGEMIKTFRVRDQVREGGNASGKTQAGTWRRVLIIKQIGSFLLLIKGKSDFLTIEIENNTVSG